MLFMTFWNILLQNHKVFEQIKEGVSGRAKCAVVVEPIKNSGKMEYFVTDVRQFVILKKAGHTGYKPGSPPTY